MMQIIFSIGLIKVSPRWGLMNPGAHFSYKDYAPLELCLSNEKLRRSKAFVVQIAEIATDPVMRNPSSNHLFRQLFQVQSIEGSGTHHQQVFLFPVHS